MPDIREELKNLRNFNSSYEGLQERITRLRTAMEGLNRVMQNSPDRKAGHRGHDKLAKLMDEVEELELQLAQEVIGREKGIRGLEQCLVGLPASQQQVLRLRYVKGLKWKAVAKEMDYSVDHCFRLHRKALKKMPVNASFFCDKM